VKHGRIANVQLGLPVFLPQLSSNSRTTFSASPMPSLRGRH
jgi:hypothetical protein